ncbi:hypothetical protein CCACVL1_21693 [Corchorus capsularis]|uniref:Uncharacterized protein n=1 Tax=Corchorus capsularis TaxID=210143 RepID=A0A1R3H2F7_COCAP|nr:hypothetical protein CCACVL1_21693 [Corchorus capsularis]
MALPLTRATQNRVPSSYAFFKPLRVKPSRVVTTTRPKSSLQVKASSLNGSYVQNLKRSVRTIPNRLSLAAVSRSIAASQAPFKFHPIDAIGLLTFTGCFHDKTTAVVPDNYKLLRPYFHSLLLEYQGQSLHQFILKIQIQTQDTDPNPTF